MSEEDAEGAPRDRGAFLFPVRGWNRSEDKAAADGGDDEEAAEGDEGDADGEQLFTPKEPASEERKRENEGAGEGESPGPGSAADDHQEKAEGDSGEQEHA